ncbi:MAG: LysM peptidoglycan-binding domain-containing protein [Bacteroidetes bacterium]|nr:MAG: LysM peptidoglycan-binding domain-containing protein [Bacteroidota bacterium]
MKPSQLFSFLLAMVSALFSNFSSASTPFNTSEIRERIESMDLIVEPRYNTDVERYIRTYLGRSKRSAAIVIGRTATYFPIFEKYLEEHNLPKDLKYLAIVESALNPKARSPVGAGGLWQFMRQTGRLYGLTINRTVDERSCPHSSTEAAMKYLARLYERFGSWELALAAYNAGAGTILRAQRRAGADDYWAISKYLPRETRRFVPAFIGAAYIVNFYKEHDVQPEWPHLDMQLIEAFKVYHPLKFTTIAAVTGLPLEVVRALNPHFRRGSVPGSEKGHFVILPKRVIPALKEYLETQQLDGEKSAEKVELPPLVDTAEYNASEFYFKADYTVVKGDKLQDLARTFGCSVYSLQLWNDLHGSKLRPGQNLIAWFPVEERHFGEEKIIVKKVKLPKRLDPARRMVAIPQVLAYPEMKTVAQISAPEQTPFSLELWSMLVMGQGQKNYDEYRAHMERPKWKRSIEGKINRLVKRVSK